MPSAITKGANKDQNENNSAPNTWGGVHFARRAAAPLFAGGLQLSTSRLSHQAIKIVAI